MYRKFIIALLFSWAASLSQAQQVTISNNLLYDATLTPNLRVGLRLSPHWSLGMTAGYRPWPTSETTNTKWKHLLLSPSVRYWKDSVNVHHFFGSNIIYSHYNMANLHFPFGLYKSVRDERRQGDMVALGVFYGYSWPLGRRWNIEALIGAAVGWTVFDRYECGHCGKKLGREHRWFGMPQAAVNIVYNIPGRPQKAKAVEEPAPTPTRFVPAIHNVADNTGRAGQLQKENPALAHISEYRPYDRTRIMRKEQGALFVHFEKGETELNADYRDNGAVMNRIIDITRQITADNTSSVKKIQLVGLASIDGPAKRNEAIAAQRAENLQSYIQQQVDVPDSLFDTVGGGEAWADFRDQLAELAASNDPQAAHFRKAVEIIDTESDDATRESKLRKLNYGHTWKYIKENILADQRNSGYIRIYYDYVPDENAKIINDASGLLTTDCGDCHREALSLLQQVRGDERAQNALGVALWLNGKRTEAIECFRRAAANGNADAATNLQQLEQRINK